MRNKEEQRAAHELEYNNLILIMIIMMKMMVIIVIIIITITILIIIKITPTHCCIFISFLPLF